MDDRGELIVDSRNGYLGYLAYRLSKRFCDRKPDRSNVSNVLFAIQIIRSNNFKERYVNLKFLHEEGKEDAIILYVINFNCRLSRLDFHHF